MSQSCKKKSFRFIYKNHKGEVKPREIIPQGIEYGIAPGQDHAAWLLWGVDIEKNEQRAFVLNHIKNFDDELKPQSVQLDRHFCVTVYIFNQLKTKTLLLFHRKLNRWIPPGGHVDINELPEEAARREVFEETGLDVNLAAERPSFDGALLRPDGLQLNPIVAGKHEHIDFVFQAQVHEEENLTLNELETKGLRWFDIAEVRQGRVVTFPSIIYWLDKMTGNPKC